MGASKLANQTTPTLYSQQTQSQLVIVLKGWWAGKTKARLAAKASGAIGKLSKEIGREAMLPAAVEAWNSYYSYRYRYSYYSTGTGSTIENSCYTSRQNVAPHTRTTWIHQAVGGLY